MFRWDRQRPAMRLWLVGYVLLGMFNVMILARKMVVLGDFSIYLDALERAWSGGDPRANA